MERNEFVAMVAEQFKDNIDVEIDREKFRTCLEKQVDGSDQERNWERRKVVNDFLKRYKVHIRLYSEIDCWDEVDIFDAPINTTYFARFEWCPDHGVVEPERYERYADLGDGTKYVLDLECPECTQLLAPPYPISDPSPTAYGLTEDVLKKIQ